MNKSLLTLSTLVVILTGALAAGPNIPSLSQKVIDVIDGDTIVMANHQRVRLRGLNAPEIGLCGSAEATKYLKNQVLNKKVILTEPIGDRWGRVVALVYLNDKLINLDMINQGFGHYESGPISMQSEFQAASLHAQADHLGVYNSKCYQTENIANPKCNIKGNINLRNNTKIYHLPACTEYPRVIVETSLGEQWFCKESEALSAGYVKSANCP